MTDLDTILTELSRAPDAYGYHKVRMYAVEMAAEIARLRKAHEHTIGRLAAATEVLCKISNKEKLCCPNCKTEWIIE